MAARPRRDDTLDAEPVLTHRKADLLRQIARELARTPDDETWSGQLIETRIDLIDTETCKRTPLVGLTTSYAGVLAGSWQDVARGPAGIAESKRD